MKRFWSLLVVLSLFGCAHSPQQVALAPVVSLEGAEYGRGRALLLSAEDRRETTVLGSRGGVYAESSLISVSRDSVVSGIGQIARAKLAAQGFAVNSSQGSPIGMTLALSQLSYQVEKTTLGVTVSLLAELRSEVTAHQGSIGSKQFAGSYQATQQHTFVMAPSDEKNRRLINQVLGSALQQALEDPKLRAFLGQ